MKTWKLFGILIAGYPLGQINSARTPEFEGQTKVFKLTFAQIHTIDKGLSPNRSTTVPFSVVITASDSRGLHVLFVPEDERLCFQSRRRIIDKHGNIR